MKGARTGITCSQPPLGNSQTATSCSLRQRTYTNTEIDPSSRKHPLTSKSTRQGKERAPLLDRAQSRTQPNHRSRLLAFAFVIGHTRRQTHLRPMRLDLRNPERPFLSSGWNCSSSCCCDRRMASSHARADSSCASGGQFGCHVLMLCLPFRIAKNEERKLSTGAGVPSQTGRLVVYSGNSVEEITGEDRVETSINSKEQIERITTAAKSTSN